MPSAGGQFNQSPIFSATTGFGGNGIFAPVVNTTTNSNLPGGTGGGCITDGPFADVVLNVGPGMNATYNPRCLSRNFNPTIAESHLRYDEDVAPIMAQAEFNAFQLAIDPVNGLAHMTCHGGGHVGVGGEVS